MTKSELSAKWSKYCNTDKLVDDMMALLSEYSHENSVHGVCTLLDTYFTNKEPLIKLIASSKHYIGDMRVVTLEPFNRVIDANEVYNAVRNLERAINTDSMLSTTDSKGKGLLDYLAVGKTFYDIDKLPTESEQSAKREAVQKFDYSMLATNESIARRANFATYMNYFRSAVHSTMQRDICYDTTKGAPVLKEGMKTSRAFNKVCHYYGIDKMNPQTITTEENGQTVTKTTYPYDKLYATYADTVSDLVRKMHFVISVNPLDYLTMSFGVNWKSCHSINGGGWKGGCLSYMLDNTSMITYVLTEMKEPLHTALKVYRQMFHYDNGLFMQNRLYPQGNDGATNLYTKFRGLVVKEFSDIMHEGGEWSAEIGPNSCTSHSASQGSHYVDYSSNRDCAIFYPRSKAEMIRNHIMNIGHRGICVRCGREYSSSSYLAHRHRADCGSF
jgi:hypothetical protein